MTLADLVAVFDHWLHLPDHGPLYAVLGAVAANHMPGDPVWVMLIAPPSSGKTEILQAFTGLPRVFPTATLNEAALLSGTPRKERDTGATGGLLNELGEFGIIVCKDFTSVVSMAPEARKAVLAALREIYDGRWTRRLGSGGGMSLDWKGKVGLLAGCTHVIDSAHAVTSAMGERFIQYRMSLVSEDDEAAQAQSALARRQREEEMRAALADAVSTFFAELPLPSTAPMLTDDETSRLGALAKLVARSRSAVERDGYHRHIESVPPPEVSIRLLLSLKGLFSGLLAIRLLRDTAWEIVVRAGFDSIPGLRGSVLQMLIAAGGALLSTQALADQTRCSPTAVRRALEDLEAHGIVAQERGAGRAASRWGLTEWAWTQYEAAIGCVPAISGDAA